MAVTLLPVSNGRVSLELAPEDVPGLVAAIRARYGEPGKAVLPTATEYRFGGCRFVYQDEWDDPCLVSGSPEGDEILRILHADLTALDGLTMILLDI